MPIVMNSFLTPVSSALPYLLDDTLVRGGLRCLATLDARDAIAKGSRKVGMLVYVSENSKMYQMGADLTTWLEANLGGKSYKFNTPFVTAEDSSGQIVVDIDSAALLPPSNAAGKTLQSGPNNTVVWVDASPGADRGVRITTEYQASASIAPGKTLDVDLDMAKTCLLIHVTLDSIDVALSCYSTEAREDRNPYLFRSSTNFLSDDGVRTEDGTLYKDRRYSIIANDSGDTKQFWRFTNLGTTPVTPKLTLTYLVLE